MSANYQKMSSSDYYWEAKRIMENYKIFRDSFCRRFAQYRSKDLLMSLGVSLLNEGENAEKTIYPMIRELDKMTVMFQNNGNIIFH